ncbi:MAG TPA: YggS family pyridoxal phosphate-dependent enzyme [Rudaea sp.]|nr:YggS family pyridoxal phosphate-dependent enzyme [Rudaea sp.]
MTSSDAAYATIRERVSAAARRAGHPARVLAVSKTKPASSIRELAALGQLEFGENYVQEALAKQRELGDLPLQWHLIGPLQSNKCREVSEHFDWLESLDREKLIAPLNRYRPEDRPALNLLIQVNIDAEASKSGCAPGAVAGLARRVAEAPRLLLRGLMAIPEPHPDLAARRAAFGRMRELFDDLRKDHPSADTLSLGMSDDFELAIEEGATLVRIGTALFGART